MTLKDYSMSTKPAVSAKEAEGLESMSQVQLLKLRGDIDNLLGLDLKHINLTEELALQLRKGKALLDEAENATDKDRVPLNQRAALFTSVTNMIQRIEKMQQSVYSMERLKCIESSVLKAMETLPDPARHAFFDLYGRFLKEAEAKIDSETPPEEV